MTEFEKAVEMSFEKYVASLPSVVPSHNFSQKHIDAMNELFYPKPELKRKKLLKKTVRIIIIAAVLLSLAVTAVATSLSHKYTIDEYPNRLEYRVENIKNVPKLTPLKVNYVPQGFDKTANYKKEEYTYSKLDKYFVIDKYTLDKTVAFYDDEYDSEEIEINGAKAIFYKTSNNNGIIFNDGKYVFEVMGNIEKEELVKIAQKAE